MVLKAHLKRILAAWKIHLSSRENGDRQSDWKVRPTAVYGSQTGKSDLRAATQQAGLDLLLCPRVKSPQRAHSAGEIP